MRILVHFSALIAISAILVSCNGGSSENQRPEGNGGTVRIAEVSPPKNTFPQALTTQVEGLVAGQIFECLVRLNPKTLEPIPGLAEKWDVSPDGKTITFHLRKGVHFQPCDTDKEEVGPELTSKDVKFTFELLCTDRPTNMHFPTIGKDRIVGANEFFDASSKGQKSELAGFKIIDDYTFSISLNNASSIFLQMLANPVTSIICEEAYKTQKENLKCGAGPFKYDTKASTPTHIVLLRNEHYYGKDEKGNSLPLIDSVVIDILGSTEEGLTLFKEGKYDYLGSIPSNSVRQVVEENIKAFESNPPTFILERSSEMITQYYVLNINKVPFNNIKVRQAVNYALDRDKIIDKVLRGQAFGPAINGITPPTFSGYKISDIQGYEFNPDKAKHLMIEAGYPGGIGLPELSLVVNTGNSRNMTVAAEVQKQLKEVLNVNITFEALPTGDKFNMQVKGKGDMFRDGWIADYPSPESFLSVFYGEPIPLDSTKISYPNTQRYLNPVYDEFYKKGRDARNKDSAMFYFMKAENVLMHDAPLIPLWYESNYRLITARVKNFFVNPLRYFDLTKVTIVNPTAATPEKK